MSLKIQLERLPKFGIDTPDNQYHIFNTTFSIPYFQYHMLHTVVKFIVFTEKIVKLKKIRLHTVWKITRKRDHAEKFSVKSTI